MSETAAVQRFAYTLGANEAFNIAMPGTFVYLESATGDFAIEKNNTGGQLQIPSGTKVRFTEQFQSIRIIDKSGAANTIIVYIGAGDVEIAGATTIVGTVTVQQGAVNGFSASTSVTTGTTSTTVVGSAASSRRALTIRAFDTNTGKIWISDVSPAIVGRGVPLFPGETRTLPYFDGTIFAISDGSATDGVWRDTETFA